MNLDALDSLPEPVSRYLRRALRAGQPPIRIARLAQVGELRTDVRSDRWLSFKASQVIAPLATGFSWDARVALAPFLHLRVRDAYLAGQGSGQVALLSAIPVASEIGGVEMTSGSLHRYLAEAVWYPTALLPGPALQWTPVDARRALARLTHAGTAVSLEFRFSDADEVSGIYSQGRWGRFEGGFRQAPWEGHFSGYAERDGMWVPSGGEVGWYSSGEWHCVWRGAILEARYEFARQPEVRAPRDSRR